MSFLQGFSFDQDAWGWGSALGGEGGMREREGLWEAGGEGDFSHNKLVA